jgi:metallophosphoesterase (TIGR00282 family)
LLDRLRALVLGDVVGKPGCRALTIGLKDLIKRHRVDLVIANGENASDGRGITPTEWEGLLQSGVDVVTSGNHIWQKKEILPLLTTENCLLRPQNYPKGVPGRGHCIITIKEVNVGVCNLEGRHYLSDLRCPFEVGRETVRRLKRDTSIIIVDFHAESQQEKEALGIYLDGTVSAVIGTHTHVQTADERILAGGTAYITDIGMTGPGVSCIGMGIQTAIRRSLTQMPLKMEVADRTADINGVFLEIDTKTGKSLKIERIHETALV